MDALLIKNYNEMFMLLSGDGVSEGGQGFEPQVLTSQPQTMEELVAQAMPGTSGLQGVSVLVFFFNGACSLEVCLESDMVESILICIYTFHPPILY